MVFGSLCPVRCCQRLMGRFSCFIRVRDPDQPRQFQSCQVFVRLRQDALLGGGAYAVKRGAVVVEGFHGGASFLRGCPSHRCVVEFSRRKGMRSMVVLTPEQCQELERRVGVKLQELFNGKDKDVSLALCQTVVPAVICTL